MTPQNKLYEAAKALIGDFINKRSHFNSFQNLCRVLSEYEQSTEQPEAIAGEKTIDDYIKTVKLVDGNAQFCLRHQVINGSLLLDLRRIMSEYTSQQTSAKDKEIKELKTEIDRLKQQRHDWACHILKVRDALAENDQNEAYHWLYQIASPNFDKDIDEVWKEIEVLATPPTTKVKTM